MKTWYYIVESIDDDYANLKRTLCNMDYRVGEEGENDVTILFIYFST